MSVKLHLMLNSKMLIDGDGEGDPIIATSLREASNLLVLKVIFRILELPYVLKNYSIISIIN